MNHTKVQTGVRMERRLVKVLKALAELRDLTLAPHPIGLEADRVLIVHEEDEDIPVGGVEGGRALGVHCGVACRRHPPALVGVQLPHRTHDLMVVDAAVVGTDEAAQFETPGAGVIRLRPAHELHPAGVRQVPESQVQSVGGEGGAGRDGRDLPEPLGRRVRRGRELAETPMGRVQLAQLLVLDGEQAAGDLAPPTKRERVVSVRTRLSWARR